MKSLDFTGFLKKVFLYSVCRFSASEQHPQKSAHGNDAKQRGKCLSRSGRRGRFLIAVPVFKNCSRGIWLNIDCGRWEGKVLKNVQRAILSVWGCVLSEGKELSIPNRRQPMFSTSQKREIQPSLSSRRFPKGELWATIVPCR